MSVQTMAQVWGKDLPFNKSWVLMAMADHADHEGKGVFPRIGLIAWKTGYSVPSIKRIIANLRDDGILLPYGHTKGGVVIYRIVLKHIADKPEFVSEDSGRPTGTIERTPREKVEENGDDSRGGYQIDTPFYDTHNHPFNNKEQSSFQPSASQLFDDPEIQDFGDEFSDMKHGI